MKKRSVWLSVNKFVPSNNREVLVYAPGCNIIGSILIGRYFNGNKKKRHKPSWTVYDFDGSKFDERVTYWTELPDAP